MPDMHGICAGDAINVVWTPLLRCVFAPLCRSAASWYTRTVVPDVPPAASSSRYSTWVPATRSTSGAIINGDRVEVPLRAMDSAAVFQMDHLRAGFDHLAFCVGVGVDRARQRRPCVLLRQEVGFMADEARPCFLSCMNPSAVDALCIIVSHLLQLFLFKRHVPSVPMHQAARGLGTFAHACRST